MPVSFVLPEPLKHYLACRPGTRLEKIHAEASQRNFFRIRRGGKTLVAMIYPEPSRAEVEKFCATYRILRSHGLRVPRIDQVLDDQVVVQEDCGDLLLQRAWRLEPIGRRRLRLGHCREMLGRLVSIPPGLATVHLDAARRKREMDFFITHFHPRFPVRSVSECGLRNALHCLVEAVGPGSTFAHRDFHSRNLLVMGREIVMVDFQDALLAPRFYDLVSLAFDSYLDLGASRGELFPNLAAAGDDRTLRQLRLTALQRNIKALGTFAYQTYERKHPAYARYIPRTIRHIRGHLQTLSEPGLDILSQYFNSL